MLPSICFFRNRRIFTLTYTNNKEKKSEEEDIEYSRNEPHSHKIQEFSLTKKQKENKQKKNHSMDVEGTAGKSKSGRLILGKI